ncbi:xylose ABC transporter [Silvibacterium dinghuense]|uniref:Xylose ABC transporter n=1 Tax=Silvibacterium dinghuense TaxID=1560006 RepID=A0A4Q1SCR1_9BACT|nr:xylose ABC transporter [Silvibacterium dinghuense]RXS94883.1 xylose ABC transporter [Silvibacterium dinghuense]GGH08716.1 hypothetical protein GCM10011586_26380 [Silvibacterium dinghuense]
MNQHAYLPGDCILLHAESRWQGQLHITNSGSEGLPIRIDRYGQGSWPRIDGAGLAREAVSLINVSYMEVRHLEITNHTAQPALLRGVLVAAIDSGTVRHIVLSDLYLHDISGTEKKKDSGGIIFQTSGSHIPSRFDDLRIERNLLWKVDRSAIAGLSDEADRTRWFPSLHVVIRDNVADDIGGDGIVPWATDGALLEHNIVWHANQRAESYNAAIWPWSTDNTTLRWNEAAWTHSTLDGEGFDSDYNSRNTQFFQNYSHDNDGGFMLLCTPVRRDVRKNFGNSGTVVAYNISRNDHSRTFHLSGADSVTIHHNAIYTAQGEDVQLLLVSDWDGWSNDARLAFNLFDVQGAGRYGHGAERHSDGTFSLAPGWGGATEIQFQCNHYVGRQIDAPQDSCSPDDQAKAVKPLDWSMLPPEPTFNPRNPTGLPVFLSAHRKWMYRLFSLQFSANIKLYRP